jgi:hypothetical protein
MSIVYKPKALFHKKSYFVNREREELKKEMNERMKELILKYMKE